MKKQLVGVCFTVKEPVPATQGNEYLYWDTLGCKVGDTVVVETRDSIALAKVTAIYVATSRETERPIRNVVSKVESAYTKAQEEAKTKKARLAQLYDLLRGKLFEELSWLDVMRVVAKENDEVAELLKEYDELVECFKLEEQKNA